MYVNKLLILKVTNYLQANAVLNHASQLKFRKKHVYGNVCSACCQGTVFDRMPPQFGKQFGVFYPCAECCGAKLYPPNPKKICCAGTIQVRDSRVIVTLTN